MKLDCDFTKLTLEDKRRLLFLYQQQAELQKYNQIDTYFTDEGINSRARYAKHIPFFEAGKDHKHRLIMAGNRSGKSLLTCYELSCHLMGEYPIWWTGKRLTQAVSWWVVGVDNNTIRQSIIKTLVGQVGAYGTGLIRHRCLDFETMTDTTKVATTITSLRVKHSTGAFSQVDFKTYEQSVDSFQAVAVNVIFDEEPPLLHYAECLKRTMTLGENAMTIMNFTPLKGLGEVIPVFLEGHDYETGAINESKHLTHFSMDDAPHLALEDIEVTLSLTPPYLREAVRNGIPTAGEGNVYPIDEKLITIDPLDFTIPSSWKRFAAMDFGFKDPTVVLWFALNPDSGVYYIYAEHYLSDALVSTHAEIIKAQNKIAGYPIPIVCDPSGGGTNSSNGEQVRNMYKTDYDITMFSAENAIHAGIAKTFQAMVDGKLKIYKTCVNTIKEFRSYQKYKNGFKGADHAMDAMRYGVMSGLAHAKSKYDIETESKAADTWNYTPKVVGKDGWLLS